MWSQGGAPARAGGSAEAERGCSALVSSPLCPDPSFRGVPPADHSGKLAAKGTWEMSPGGARTQQPKMKQKKEEQLGEEREGGGGEGGEGKRGRGRGRERRKRKRGRGGRTTTRGRASRIRSSARRKAFHPFISRLGFQYKT